MILRNSCRVWPSRVYIPKVLEPGWADAYDAPPFFQGDGWIAQLVEQRIENPCVPGSIPGPATIFPAAWLHDFSNGGF